MPDEVPLDVATAVTLQGMTAHYLLRSVHPLQKDEWCVIHAGAGGVGQLALQIAKNCVGAKVVTTTAGPKEAEKTAICEARGADVVVNYKDVVDAVKTATGGRGVNVVYDGVGKATFELSLDCCAIRVRVPYGNASGAVPAFDPLVLNDKGSLKMCRPKLPDHLWTAKKCSGAVGSFPVDARGPAGGCGRPHL